MTEGIDFAKASDMDFIFEVLKSQNKEAYCIRNERAWRQMSKIVCTEKRFQITTVYRNEGKQVGFYSVPTDPAAFWNTFIYRYGCLRFLWQKIKDAGNVAADKVFVKRYTNPSRYVTVPGRAYCFFSMSLPR